MTDPQPEPRIWTRYVAVGDSFTEGMSDPDPEIPDRYVGWADRLAVDLARYASDSGQQFGYANLAVRGRLLPRHVRGHRFDIFPESHHVALYFRRICTARLCASRPSASASIAIASETARKPFASDSMMLVRRRKEYTLKPENARAVPPVGSVWLGPAT